MKKRTSPAADRVTSLVRLLARGTQDSEALVLAVQKWNLTPAEAEAHLRAAHERLRQIAQTDPQVTAGKVVVGLWQIVAEARDAGDLRPALTALRELAQIANLHASGGQRAAEDPELARQIAELEQRLGVS